MRILGWMSTGAGTYLSPNQSWTAGTFVPVWVMARHQWTAAQTWSTGNPGEFPTGNDGTGCFVTVTGCQKVY